MARKPTITDQQAQQIFELASHGMSERAIATQLGLTKTIVHGSLTRRGESDTQQKVAAIVSKPVVASTSKSVFDIMGQLEDCLKEVQELMDEDGQLKDRVAVRSEKRMLIAEARATLESIYNIKVLNEFVTAVTAILESESPGARQRIYNRLEASANANAARVLFADS